MRFYSFSLRKKRKYAAYLELCIYQVSVPCQLLLHSWFGTVSFLPKWCWHILQSFVLASISTTLSVFTPTRLECPEKNEIDVLFFFFLKCNIFIEICTFVSWIHKVPVPYRGLVNISKAHKMLVFVSNLHTECLNGILFLFE
jgi:hypothetical protein